MSTASHRLSPIFNARDIAIVGASERGLRSLNAIEAMEGRQDLRLHLVNPKGDDVRGRRTARSLTQLAEEGIDIDAAMIFTNPQAAIAVTAEAASLGVGGVIVNAGGFAEAGGGGVQLQNAIVEAAGEMPVLGPNCNGIMAPSRGLHLAGSPPNLPILGGGLAFITHSGATMLPMAIAGVERKVGFSFLISTGNEANVDMAEAIDFLATDDSTSAICLLIETIRNPQAFWAAVDRAISAGKPVLALKNGRSARGSSIARSHTGAVTGEAWAYAAALRQHGVILADDLVDLADRAVLFDQIPRERWSKVDGLAVLSGSGGWVTMASDVCAEEGIELPALESLRNEVSEVVPGVGVVNPLDLTGRAMTDRRVMESALDIFTRSDEVDTVLLQSTLSDEARAVLSTFAAPALDVAPTTNKLLLVGSIEGGPIGSALAPYTENGIGVTRGLRATVRALASMSDFMRYTPTEKLAAEATEPIPGPPGRVLKHPAAGTLLDFASTMQLLTAFGIKVADHLFVHPGTIEIPRPMFAPPYVVKLADVPHRTDIGAVRLNVDDEKLQEAINDLRALAHLHGESAMVVIQRQTVVEGELLVGVTTDSGLGPLVVCGPGGVLVEVLNRVSGRLAPFGNAEAHRLLADIDGGGILDGPRGSLPWPREELASTLSSMSQLAAACAPWLESLDVNPLALTANGIVALDGLVLVRSATATPTGPTTEGSHIHV